MDYFDIQLVGNINKTVIINKDTTVSYVKDLIEKGADIEMIYKGHILEDDEHFSDYGISEDDKVYYVILKHNINPITNTLLSLFNTFLGQNIPNQSDINYDEQIQTLNNMGFMDDNENKRLLMLFGGDVESVISSLLGDT